MSRTRRWTAVGIVGVLALALGGLLWRNSNTAAPTPTSTTSLQAIVTTTNTPSTTATTVVSPTTSAAEQRVAEVEAILSDLWFGWFDAIYRQDSDALWNVVATTSFQQAGVRAMEQLEFDEAPTSSELNLVVDNVLLDRSDCLVVENTVSMQFLNQAPSETGVNVLWFDSERGWRFATAWIHPGDLWLADCDDVEREVTP